MKKIVMVLCLLCFAVWPAVTLANEGLVGDLSLPEGGVHVDGVEALPDGTSVVMVGRIEQYQGSTMYNFSDETGTTIISIDYAYQDEVEALSVNDIVEVYGVTMHDFDKFFVQVDRIVKR